LGELNRDEGCLNISHKLSWSKSKFCILVGRYILNFLEKKKVHDISPSLEARPSGLWLPMDPSVATKFLIQHYYSKPSRWKTGPLVSVGTIL
jgi:hypothetical protein